MANLSDFFPAGGGGGALTNTFAVFSINSGGVNPNFDSATKIYTDENGGKWLETGNTIDVTDAISAEYPYANSKFFNYNTLSANATSGTRDINGWTSSFLYDFTSSTNFKFFARKYRSYNNQIGFYSYNYSGAGTIITHPPSNSAGTPTPIPYGYNPNNAAGEQGVMLIASGNDMLLQLFSVTSHSTTATATIATYTNGNLNAQNKVRHAYFDGNSANSNIHVPYVVSNAIKLDIYSYSGGAYSLSSTKTLALTSDTLTVP